MPTPNSPASKTFLKRWVGGGRRTARTCRRARRGRGSAQRAPGLVADLVQHQALARGEAKPEPPLLPGDVVAVHREARALRLGDLERLEVSRDARPARSRSRSTSGVVVARRGRERHDAVVARRRGPRRVEVPRRPGPPPDARSRSRPVPGAHVSGRAMRRSAASSSGPVQLDAHGSTIVREKSVTPRLRMASCQRGSACTISSQAMNSSAMIGACTPGIGSQDTTDCRSARPPPRTWCARPARTRRGAPPSAAGRCRATRPAARSWSAPSA